MKIGIESLASWFPEKVMKREDFNYLDPVIPPGLERVFRGPDEFRRFEGDDAAEVMAVGAAAKALDRAGLKPADIDFILSGSIGGKYTLPMVGSHVHHEMGFPQEVPAVNLSTCCASFVDAANIAWNLVQAGNYKRILIVMVTSPSRDGVDTTQPVVKLFGDGAGAAVVSDINLKCEFLSYTNQTFGEVYMHMNMIPRRVEHPELLKDPAKEIGNFIMADEWFYSWQQKQGKFFAVEGIEPALKKAGLSFSDLDYVVIHQAQDVLHDEWKEGGKEVGLREEQWKETWHKYANIGNVDIVPNLEELWEEGKLHNGSILALFPPGMGGHTPCMIVRWLA